MENWQEFTEETIAALLEDGSDPDALYTIEHHFYDHDFAKYPQMYIATKFMVGLLIFGLSFLYFWVPPIDFDTSRAPGPLPAPAGDAWNGEGD